MRVWPIAWIVQRVCAIFLIVAAPIKLFTGYAFTLKISFISFPTALKWHTSPILDSMLIIGASFHVFYGLRTILIDLGAKRETFLFWLGTSLSFLFSLTVIYFIYFGG